MTLTKTDLQIVLDMLEYASDQLYAAGCGDWELPNTPETIAWLRAMYARLRADDPEYPPEDQIVGGDFQVDEDDETVEVFGGDVADYCIERVKEAIDSAPM